LEQCHKALDITIFVDGFSVFIGLCSFQVNGSFADRTDWSIHTSPPGKGFTHILARSLGIARCQIFRVRIGWGQLLLGQVAIAVRGDGKTKFIQPVVI
jgi:hypothetical protein